MRDLSLGFMAGVAFMIILSVLDAWLYRRTARKRFDAEVNKVLGRDLTYRSRRN